MVKETGSSACKKQHSPFILIFSLNIYVLITSEVCQLPKPRVSDFGTRKLGEGEKFYCAFGVLYEPPHDKTNKMSVCPAKTRPDQSLR